MSLTRSLGVVFAVIGIGLVPFSYWVSPGFGILAVLLGGVGFFLLFASRQRKVQAGAVASGGPDASGELRGTRVPRGSVEAVNDGAGLEHPD